MALIDLADDTFIVGTQEELSAIVHTPQRWKQWWPGLDLVIFMDRGLDGMRWSAVGDPTGSVEIWLEPVKDGVVVHHYLRLDPADFAGQTTSRLKRRAARSRERYATSWKQSVWALKDAIEGGRAVGSPRDSRDQHALPIIEK